MKRFDRNIQQYAALLDQAATEAAEQPRSLGTPARERGTRTRRLVVSAVGGFGLVAVVIALIVTLSVQPQKGRVAVGSFSNTTSGGSALGNCPSATFDSSGVGDGLPNADLVTQAAVDTVFAQSRDQISRAYGAAGLATVSVVSNALTTDAKGGTAVTRGTIYVIEVTLASADSCPPAPQFYNGVPLIFQIEAANS
jgi:hypothetical protein